MIRRCSDSSVFTLLVVHNAYRTTHIGGAVTGTVLEWNHIRGFGRVDVGSSPALVSRAALDGGFYLTPGQVVTGDITYKANARLARVRTEQGNPIRPRCIKGVITQWNTLLQQGWVSELDLAGNLLPEAPRFSLSAQDYECDVPKPALDLPVLFCALNGAAKRAILSFKPSETFVSSGRIRELREHHGFLVDKLTGESIYFKLSSLLQSDLQPGEQVQYKVIEEPPVSYSAGKKIAISISRVV